MRIDRFINECLFDRKQIPMIIQMPINLKSVFEFFEFLDYIKVNKKFIKPVSGITITNNFVVMTWDISKTKKNNKRLFLYMYTHTMVTLVSHYSRNQISSIYEAKYPNYNIILKHLSEVIR